MRSCLAGLALLAASSGAVAAPCNFDAYFVDQDPLTNIRAAPSTSSAVIARVDPGPAVARLREHRDGWFRADSIIDYDTDKPLFTGSGWVHGSVIGISVAGGDHRLRARPSRRSAAIQRLTPDGNMLDLLDCSGEWVKVRVDGRAVGWMAPDAQCANPFTTCS